jgi:hypothetical protein
MVGGLLSNNRTMGLTLVLFGDTWCHNVRSKTKRFSVSLSEDDYEQLQNIAKKHRPQFTLQYLVNWSVQQLLERSEDPQLLMDLGNPIERGDT